MAMRIVFEMAAAVLKHPKRRGYGPKLYLHTRDAMCFAMPGWPRAIRNGIRCQMRRFGPRSLKRKDGLRRHPGAFFDLNSWRLLKYLPLEDAIAVVSVSRHMRLLRRSQRDARSLESR